MVGHCRLGVVQGLLQGRPGAQLAKGPCFGGNTASWSLCCECVFCKAAPLCILVDPSGCPVLLAVQYCLHWGLSCTLSRAIMVMGLFLVPSKPPVQVGSCSKV